MTDTAAPLVGLTAALIARLRSGTVATLVPAAAIVNTLPPNPTLPMVRVRVRGKPMGPIAGQTQWECEAEIDVFTTYQGDAQAFGIASAAIAQLNLQSLAVAGWTVLLMSVLDVVTIPDEFVNGDEVKRLLVPVLLLVEAA